MLSTACTTPQEQLRDEPLCSLQLPLLFLRGTSDPFSTDGPWQSIQPRLQSSDLQVRGGWVGGSGMTTVPARRILPSTWSITHLCDP